MLKRNRLDRLASLNEGSGKDNQGPQTAEASFHE
jgi:hypothetical protein